MVPQPLILASRRPPNKGSELLTWMENSLGALDTLPEGDTFSGMCSRVTAVGTIFMASLTRTWPREPGKAQHFPGWTSGYRGDAGVSSPLAA